MKCEGHTLDAAAVFVLHLHRRSLEDPRTFLHLLDVTAGRKGFPLSGEDQYRNVGTPVRPLDGGHDVLHQGRAGESVAHVIPAEGEQADAVVEFQGGIDQLGKRYIHT
jgi:hypothetical protein